MVRCAPPTVLLLALLFGGCALGAGRPGRVIAPTHAALPSPLPEGAESDWPMFRDDVERTGFAEGSTVGARAELLWRRPAFNTTAYGAVKGSPAVVGSTVYCGTDTGRLVAARTADGAVLWQRAIEHTTHGIHGSPAIVGDAVYIGAYDGALYALDRATGAVRWRHAVGEQVGSSPAVVPRWGMVFSAHEHLPRGGAVVALDARTGDTLWERPTDAHPHSSVAIDVGRARLFVGDNRGVVYAFDARTGRPAWRWQVEGPTGRVEIKTTPTVVAARGLVVVGSWSGRVYALDEDTGRVRWERQVDGRIMGSTAYLPSRDLLYVGTPSGLLLALDAATGEVRWRFRAGASILSSPAASGDGRAVVFGADNGRVYALRADSGVELWEVYVGGQVSGSPTLAGDRVYGSSRGGDLWALATHG